MAQLMHFFYIPLSDCSLFSGRTMRARLCVLSLFVYPRNRQEGEEMFPKNHAVVADMTALHHIHEPGILYNLKERSRPWRQTPYTFMVSQRWAVGGHSALASLVLRYGAPPHLAQGTLYLGLETIFHENKQTAYWEQLLPHAFFTTFTRAAPFGFVVFIVHVLSCVAVRAPSCWPSIRSRRCQLPTSKPSWKSPLIRKCRTPTPSRRYYGGSVHCGYCPNW